MARLKDFRRGKRRSIGRAGRPLSLGKPWPRVTQSRAFWTKQLAQGDAEADILTSAAALAALYAPGADAMSLSFLDADATTGRYGSAYVKDSVTPANTFSGLPYDLLTYTSPSAKMVQWYDGLLKLGAHNILTYSEDLTQSTILTGVTVSGTTDMHETSANSQHYITKSFPSIDGAAYTIEADVSPINGRTWIVLLGQASYGSSHGAYINLDGAGTIGGSYASPFPTSPTITSLGNGIYRIKATYVTAPAGGGLFKIAAATGNGVGLTFVGDPTKGIKIHHMSVYRAGADATYLKTTSAPRYSLPYEWGQNLASGLATQSVAVVASQTKAPRTYTVYYEGSGSVVMSGAASGTCVAGTPSHIRPTGTSLTLTVTGSVTKLQVRELLGILSEEARTNVLLPFSSATDVTTSTTTGVTGVSNSATLITVTAGNAAHRINFVGYTWTASVYTFSAVLTYTNHRYWQVVIWDGTTTRYANVDLLTGTVGTTSGITATLEPVGVNSYRLIGVTATLAAAAGNITFDAISSLTDAAHQAWTATGTETVIAELFQMEVGSFATSPIPTYGATVTRAADVISLPVSKFNRGTTDYSLFADFRLKRATGHGLVAYYNTTGFTQSIGLLNSNAITSAAGDRITVSAYDGTSTSINVGLVDTSNRRAVVVRSATNIAASYNGGTVMTGTTRNLSPTYLRIGGRENGLQLNGYVRGVLALPVRLADATMQEMTA